jgi:hypothetical protein
MATLVAVLLVVFLVTVVFAIDVAYMQLTRTKLRSATDAAARAAGEALSRTQDLSLARQAAITVAGENLVAGDPLVVDESEIVFGNASRQSSGAWLFNENETPINSVRVHGRRTRDSSSGSVLLLLGRLLGREDFEPEQVATVVRLDRDICLVLDRSSSMKLYLTDTDAGMSSTDPRFCEPPDPTLSRWSALASAVQTFVDALATTPQVEHLAMVSYAQEGTWCEIYNSTVEINQPLSGDHSLTINAVQTLSASVFSGGTNIRAGVDAGISALMDTSYARPYAARTMVLFTDGHETHGGSPVLGAENAALDNIIIHTVTFGDGANQADMIAVAEATGGLHFHATDETELVDIFRELALTMPVVLTE